MRNVSDKFAENKENTHFIFNIFFSENRVLYQIMLKNMAEPDRPQMTV